MPYFECADCGEVVNLTQFDRSAVSDYCPVCEERTVWTVAFDAEEGVSF